MITLFEIIDGVIGDSVRMVGGSFGGYAVVLVLKDKVNAVRAVVSDN
ncbi:MULTISPECIES: hypothetical protein [unclassified Gilliamella]|nr:hypothetical protein [Gilliamella apicola]